ncbi:MAG: peptide deformylase [Gammaproteobacteria bacterium]|nr:peptide deformylase [Gammaproteobacteria bacterium]|tara:strand:- start:748 stop:1251 length:504 start_codon:yes stop_codon:yes gene_type:complete
MQSLDILEFPDPRLRKVATPVENVTSEISEFADKLLYTMYQAIGIGLAATQVNFHKRIIAIDVSETKDNPLILINPVIVDSSGELETNEGCLSIPGFYEPVRRFEEISFKALDKMGKEYEIHTKGILAICVQHEIDHLEGKLFVDYVSSAKRQLIRKKLKKAKQNMA